MFTNRTVAGVAMLFAAFILAHPGPALAQADVDKAMGVLPPPGGPGPSMGFARPSSGATVPAGKTEGMVDTGEAFFKSVKGLAYEEEVVDYSQGGENLARPELKQRK